MKAKFEDTPSGQYNYILVWGVWNNSNEKNNTPENYVAKLIKGTKFRIEQTIRWIPLSWNVFDDKEPPETSAIEKWCWVLLAQVR